MNWMSSVSLQYIFWTICNELTKNPSSFNIVQNYFTAMQIWQIFIEKENVPKCSVWKVNIMQNKKDKWDSLQS